MSLRAVFVTIIVGVTVWTARADDHSAAATESRCRDEIERELQEYVKLDGWQKLFARHFKFAVNDRGEILSERKRLKFNTIIHNAIYGCDHGRDDEIDDCPNIYRGSITTCERGKNLRAAMFRTARCAFVESSVKHLVLSDALLDTYPAEKPDRTSVDVDAPIRRFGGTVADMLSALARGETGRLGELMALNMYLNNEYGTAVMYKAPAEPVASAADWDVARERSRRAHAAILDRLRTVWGTWCGDKDVVAQYRHKHAGDAHAMVLDAMAANADAADRLIRDLNFDAAAAGPDFEPKRIALADFVDGLIAAGSMPAAVLADLRLRRFETSYALDPPAVRAYHGHVFRAVYACFYWMTIAHLRLAARAFDTLPRGGPVSTAVDRRLLVGLVKFVRPLTVFDMNRLLFPAALSPEASANLVGLLSFLLDVYRGAKNATPGRALLAAVPRVRRFADTLHADMRTLLDARTPQPPDDRFDRVSYETAAALMRSNYRAFARLASATSRFKEDRKNAIRAKRFMPFLSEAVDPAT